MLRYIYQLLVKSKGLIFWLCLTIIIFIPLLPKFPLFKVPGTFVALRLEDLLVATTISMWLIFLVVSKQVLIIFKDTLFQAFLLFFLIGVISVFSGIFLTQTIIPHLGVLHLLRRVEYILLAPLMFWVINNRWQVKYCLVVLSITLLVVNMYAFGQKILNLPVISTTNSEFSKGQILYLSEGARVNSTFAGHYDLAVFITMNLCVISALFFFYKKIYFKLWLILISATSFVVLVMTAARLSFVATIVGILTSFWLIRKRIFILIFIFVSIATLVYPSQLRDRFLSTITVNIKQEGERYSPQTESQKRRTSLNIPTLSMGAISTDSSKPKIAFEATGSGIADITPGEPIDATDLGVYRSFAIRINYEWPAAIRAFLKNPLLGSGYSSLGLATDNDYLRSLGEVGILGTVAFALIIIAVIKRIIRAYRQSDQLLKFFSAGVLSMLVALLINALFIDVFESSKIASLFWIIIGINLGLAKVVKGA